MRRGRHLTTGLTNCGHLNPSGRKVQAADVEELGGIKLTSPRHVPQCQDQLAHDGNDGLGFHLAPLALDLLVVPGPDDDVLLDQATK